MGVLDGMKVVEIAGLGPGPFCGMVLADLGADVIAVERPAADAGRPRPSEIFNRGKRSIVLDLKKRGAVDIVLRLVERADALRLRRCCRSGRISRCPRRRRSPTGSRCLVLEVQRMWFVLDA